MSENERKVKERWPDAADRWNFFSRTWRIRATYNGEIIGESSREGSQESAWADAAARLEGGTQ